MTTRINLGIMQFMSAVAQTAFLFLQIKLITGIERQEVSAKLIIAEVVMLLAYILLQITCSYLREKLGAKENIASKNRVLQQMFSHTSKYITAMGENQCLSFVTNTVPQYNLYKIFLPLYLQELVISMVVSLVFLVYISWPIAILIIVIIAVGQLCLTRESKGLVEAQNQLIEEKSRFVDFLMNYYDAFLDIKIFNLGKTYRDSFLDRNSKLEVSNRNYLNITNRIDSITVAQNISVYCFILVVGSVFAAQGRMDVSLFSVASGIAISILNNYSMWRTMFSKKEGAKEIFKEYDSFFETEANESLVEEFSSEEDAISIEGLCFAFEGRQLLEQLNLCFKKGHKYLIVGENGCGKSTLLKLICGRIDGFKGKISVSDKPLLIDTVPFFFAGSLKENLSLGNAIDESLAQELLTRFELKYSLDFQIENDGGNLSEGEKARLGIIRALLFEPEILMLDESFTRIESELADELESLVIAKSKTLIVIAHSNYVADKYDSVIRL